MNATQPKSPRRSWRELLASEPCFCILLALTLVAARIAIFDWNYFALNNIPNHDSSQGFGFFATNLHSFRLDGEPAWWNPVSGTGYAQYYQSFFSPVAPTTHHPVFILWAHVARGLDAVGLHVSEYRQYVALNFLIMPWLANMALIALAQLLFRSRVAVAAVAIAQTLSGIGLWNESWFYYQEPFTVTFMLAAFVAVMLRPTRGRFCVLALAWVVQAVSVNYWTLYNFFFVVLFIGAYAWIYPTRWLRAWRTLRGIFSSPGRGGAWLALVLAATTLATWGVIIGSSVREQSAAYQRTAWAPIIGDGGFPIDFVVDRVAEARRLSLELFNPTIEKALRHYSNSPVAPQNAVHDARYIGCALLPFLILVPLARWSRRERWLVALAVGVFLICLATPLAVLVWKAFPMMDRHQHLFYMYSHTFQQIVVLLAGCGIDIVLSGRFSAAIRQRFIYAIVGILGLCGLAFVLLQGTSHSFANRDPVMEGNVLAAMLIAAPSILLLKLLWEPTPAMRRLLATALLALLVGDLSRYFRVVSKLDCQFTTLAFAHPASLPKATKESLSRPLAVAEPCSAFHGDVADGAPFFNSLWPNNTFMVPKVLYWFKPAERKRIAANLRDGPPVQFFAAAKTLDDLDTVRESGEIDELLEGCSLFVSSPVPDEAAADATAAAAGVGKIARWSYNSFTIDVDAPREGWLYIRQTFDRRWQIRVDGAPVQVHRANVAGMAIRVPAGAHQVVMDYQPLARRLYGFGCLLLAFFAAAMIVAAARTKTSSASIVSRPPKAALPRAA